MSATDPGHVPVGRPTWRKPAGALLILALVTAWVALIASLPVARLPAPAQAAVYVVTGIGWIWLFPFKRLFGWMERGAAPRAE